MRTMPWSKKIWVVFYSVAILGALSLGIYGCVRIVSHYEVRWSCVPIASTNLSSQHHIRRKK
jgi:hypothetical protein